MPLRPCLTCGIATRNGSWCEDHEPQSWQNRSPSSRATARPGWNGVRALAIQRDGYCCVACGATADLQVHHRLSVADGGTNTLGNLETVCSRCHKAAHGRSKRS